jgi:hypothetical protein
VERIAEGLGVAPATVPVVRALFKQVRGLPEFAWRTRKLPAETLALRDAFDSATSPERFLFVSMPEALGVPTVPATRAKKGDVATLFSALNRNLQRWATCATEVVDHARDVLLEACGFPQGENGWELLRGEALRLESAVTEPALLAFLRRVTQGGPGREGVEATIALVANRPPMNWSDLDCERFPDVAASIGAALRKAATAKDSGGFSTWSPDKLPPKERDQARRILKDLRGHLSACMRQQPKHVVAAALVGLIQELQGQRPSDGARRDGHEG